LDYFKTFGSAKPTKGIEYKTRLDYIHFNPVKHHYVSTTDMWEYSSFKKFIKKGIYAEDWCDFDQKIDFE